MPPRDGFQPAQLQRSRRWQLRCHRLWSSLRRPRSLLLILALASIAVAAAVGLWTGSLTLTLLGLMPLLLAPLLGALAYWLLWQDFHR